MNHDFMMECTVKYVFSSLRSPTNPIMKSPVSVCVCVWRGESQTMATAQGEDTTARAREEGNNDIRRVKSTLTHCSNFSRHGFYFSLSCDLWPHRTIASILTLFGLDLFFFPVWVIYLFI